MINKNKPQYKPRLQDKAKAGVPRNPQDEGTVELNDKEKEEIKIASKTTASNPAPLLTEPTGTLPAGYDPDLPMNKQREFNGLV